MATDDAGTPGPGGIEVNFIGNQDSFQGGKFVSFGIDANFGIGEYLQLRIEKSKFQQRMDSQADYDGPSSTSVGLKWRFYEEDNLKIALYPSYQADDETRQNSVDFEGRSPYLPLIVSKT